MAEILSETGRVLRFLRSDGRLSHISFCEAFPSGRRAYPLKQTTVAVFFDKSSIGELYTGTNSDGTKADFRNETDRINLMFFAPVGLTSSGLMREVKLVLNELTRVYDKLMGKVCVSKCSYSDKDRALCVTAQYEMTTKVKYNA